jgi:hypothetical protein
MWVVCVLGASRDARAEDERHDREAGAGAAIGDSCLAFVFARRRFGLFEAASRRSLSASPDVGRETDTITILEDSVADVQHSVV